MQQNDVFTKLTDVFRDVFDDDELTITPHTTAKDIPGWDSFAHINLIVATEASFHVKFKTSEIESLRDVGHLATLLERKCA
jgi:acyl carrier protein